MGSLICKANPALCSAAPNIKIRKVTLPEMETATELALRRRANRTTLATHCTKVFNGTKLLPNVDGRTLWARRASELLATHLADKPDATPAEMAIIRRASVLIVELEILEAKFAAASDGADPEELERYARVASGMRRLLESVGIQRQSREVNPLDYSRQIDDVDDADEEHEP